MQQEVASQAEALEIAMKLESTPMGESNSGMSQILSYLTSLSLQVKDIKKEKGKYKREDIWCIRCKPEGNDNVNSNLVQYLLQTDIQKRTEKIQWQIQTLHRDFSPGNPNRENQHILY
jgi:hypothetical protein